MIKISPYRVRRFFSFFLRCLWKGHSPKQAWRLSRGWFRIEIPEESRAGARAQKRWSRRIRNRLDF